MKPIKIYWEKPDNNRFYFIELKQDLFGDWVLVKTNGRAGTQLGRIRTVFCKSYQEGLKEIDAVFKIRERHGYKIMNNIVF